MKCYLCGKLSVALYSYNSIFAPMKCLYPTGNNHDYERSLQSNNIDENTASKQMKRNQTSERKNGHKTLIFHLFFLCFILMLSACDEKASYRFNSSTDAIESYKKYHYSLKAITKVDAESLANEITQWQVLHDTIFSYITKDPYYKAHASLSLDFDCVSDSIRNEFMRLSCNYTMKDVAVVKLMTSPFTNLQELTATMNEAKKFFSSLDKNPPYQNDNIAKQLQAYQEFLQSYDSKAENTMDNVKMFIAEEDRHFRSFLFNIGQYADMGLGEITLLTEKVCGNIYKNAYNGKLPQEEVLVYMSMRTARRLLMNAESCHQLLKEGKVQNPQQADAFLWMVIQPYLSMDAFTVAMLTEEQKSLMLRIANDYSGIVSVLKTKKLVDEEVSKRFPEQLIRLYISTL